MIVGLVVQVFTAIVISEMTSRKFKKFAQSATLFPYFVSWVIVAALVYNIFNYDFGVVNNIITSLGGERIDFYSNPDAWKYILVFFNTWKYFGYGTIIYLAAIVGIDKSIYESAYIDGANVFMKIWYITIPMIVPTMMTLILFNVGHIMKANFDMFYQLTGNNPQVREPLMVIEVFVFRAITQGASVNDIGYASAAGLYQSLFGFITIVIANKLVKRYSRKNALF